ncbi:hypothetical protein [Phycicoccus flavus]|uniref:hypothetical protein n=1 Tax=Phycicoccus flavus TaxID=2502783 RepID=UPI000FEBC61C|nr:hypothetical protein [Phycicoccus flavus]NHA67851.1 hypothetical protein [Phycicoccus flavus]
MTDDPAPPPSNREALAAHLDALGVRDGTYHLFGAHLDDAVVMDRRPHGWVVFFSERGGEHSLEVHRDEARACADLLSRLRREAHVVFDLVVGPAPAARADAMFDEWLRQRGVTRDDLLADDWTCDDVPWGQGSYQRRYFVRIAAIRRLDGAD